jgi:hypothetical protein
MNHQLQLNCYKVHMSHSYYSHSFQSEGQNMTVYSKQSYEDQDDGHILKAAWEKQFVMFSVPIAFLNDELKSELGMKSKKEEE